MGLPKVSSLAALITFPRAAINKLIDFKNYVSNADTETKAALKIGATLLSSTVAGATLCAYSQPWLGLALVIAGFGFSVLQLTSED